MSSRKNRYNSSKFSSFHVCFDLHRTKSYVIKEGVTALKRPSEIALTAVSAAKVYMPMFNGQERRSGWSPRKRRNGGC